MKSTILITGILISCISHLPAQVTTPIRVNAGEDLYKKLAKEIYLYDAFRNGTIFFKDNNTNQSLFNYNLLNGDMQFISDKGDTLSLANELTIRYITVGTDSFFYDDGYLQLVSANETAKVARKLRLRVSDRQKIGAYNQPSSAGSIRSYNSIENNGKNVKIEVKEDILFSKQTVYYIGDKYNNFFKATKKNILKVFNKKENELNEYFKQNKVDFNNEEDLKKMIAVLRD